MFIVDIKTKNQPKTIYVCDRTWKDFKLVVPLCYWERERESSVGGERGLTHLSHLLITSTAAYDLFFVKDSWIMHIRGLSSCSRLV